MAKVSSYERFFDFGARGKFGKGIDYGEKIFAQGFFGEEEPKIDNRRDLPISRFGIYQKRTRFKRTIWVREKFMIPLNPQTIPQQNWRTVFINGMTAWRNLTQEEREVYNENAKKHRIHGVNLFMRQWLNSNK